MSKFWDVTLVVWIAVLLSALCAAGLASPAQNDKPPQKIDVGAGFSFSLDYGTSAIYLPNDTYHVVAKVEGSPQYKLLMRQLVDDVNRGIPSDDYYLGCRSGPTPSKRWGSYPTILEAVLEGLSHIFFATFGRTIRNPFPTQTPEKPANQTVIEGMLSALKSTTESYINGTVHNALVTFPMPLPCNYSNLVQESLESLSIEHTHFEGRRVDIPAYGATFHAYGIFRCIEFYYEDCEALGYDWDPDGLWLSIDYSRAGLDIALFSAIDGVFERKGGRYTQDLGSSHIPFVGAIKHWENIRRAIKEVVDAPRDIPRHIESLFLSGELGHDPDLRKVLKDVLSTDVAVKNVNMGNNWQNTGKIGDGMVDPQFAAAVGMAMVSWDLGINCDLPPDPYTSLPDRSQGNCMSNV